MKLIFDIEFVLYKKHAWKIESYCLEFVGIPSCFSSGSASGAADREQMDVLTSKMIQRISAQEQIRIFHYNQNLH